MKVYIATSGEYSDYTIVGVFAHEQHAREHRLADDYQEFEVREHPIDVRDWWTLLWYPQGQQGIDPRYGPEPREYNGNPNDISHQWDRNGLHVPYLRVSGWDRDRVLKTYTEQRAQYLARQDTGVEQT